MNLPEQTILLVKELVEKIEKNYIGFPVDYARIAINADIIEVFIKVIDMCYNDASETIKEELKH